MNSLTDTIVGIRNVEISLPHNLSLGDVLTQRVKENPAGSFLTWIDEGGDEKTWNYSEVKQEVERLAVALDEAGVGLGDGVLLHMHNCPQFIFLFLACSLVGATALLCNVGFSHRQIHEICAISRPRIVFTQSDFVSMFVEMNEPGYSVYDISESAATNLLNFKPSKRYVKNLQINSLTRLCVVFTSGTTSSPKGVVWTHENAIFAGRSNAMQLHLNERDITYCYLPLFHVMALSYQFLTTLWVGGTFVLPHAFVPSRFWSVSVKHKCTWSVWIPHDVMNLKDFKVPTHCYRFWYAGVYLSEWEYIFKLKPVGGWGMSEMTRPLLVTNYYDMHIPSQSIGKLESRSDIYIARDDGSHIGCNEIGDLYIKGIAGKTIFKEYLNNPEATKDAFTEDGWFITNDRVRLDSNGYLFFVERKGDVFKVGGEIVSSRAVTETIYGLGFIKEAILVPEVDPQLGNIPVLFVILKAYAPDDFTSLIYQKCKEDLPGFMIPHKIILLDEFPRALLGKIATKQLKEGLKNGLYVPIKSRLKTDKLITKPTTSTEKYVYQVWLDLLNYNEIDVDSDFFDIGGSSLIAIRMCNLLNRKFNVAIYVNDLNSYSSVRKLADFIDAFQLLSKMEAARESGATGNNMNSIVVF